MSSSQGSPELCRFCEKPRLSGSQLQRILAPRWCKHRRHHLACPCCGDKRSQKHKRETTERDQGKPRLRLAVFCAAIGSHLGGETLLQRSPCGEPGAPRALLLKVTSS